MKVAVPNRQGSTVCVILLTGLLLSLFSGCKAYRGIRSIPTKSVILITVDSLRLDYLGDYGHPGIRTPNLDWLARRGLTITTSVSPSSSTLAANATVLTGLYPYQHKARIDGTLALGGTVKTLPELLHAKGYATGAFISSIFLAKGFGLERGFRNYDQNLHMAINGANIPYEQQNSGYHLFERKSDVLLTAVQPWLWERQAEKFFLWINLHDPHPPYATQEIFMTRHPQNPYAAEIEFTDFFLGQLFYTLLDLKLWDTTTVMVTGAYGESLGEHGEVGHGLSLYDATTCVPWLIADPDLQSPGSIIKATAGLIDIVPTILDLLNLPKRTMNPNQLLGQSVFEPYPQNLSYYCESFTPTLLFGWAPHRAVRTTDTKLIVGQQTAPRLYNLDQDPQELIDQSKYYLEKVDELTAAASKVIDQEKGIGENYYPPNLAPQPYYILKVLGFAQRNVKAFRPYELTIPPGISQEQAQSQFLQSYSKCEEAFTQGDFETATSCAQALLDSDPQNRSVILLLSRCLRFQQRWAEALTTIQSLLALMPQHNIALTELAMIYIQKNDLAEAEATLERTSKLYPQDQQVLYLYADVLSREGKFKDAIAAAEQLIYLDISQAESYYLLGSICLSANLPEQASTVLNRAYKLEPSNRRYGEALVQALTTQGLQEQADEIRQSLPPLVSDESRSNVKPG